VVDSSLHTAIPSNVTTSEHFVVLFRQYVGDPFSDHNCVNTNIYEQ